LGAWAALLRFPVLRRANALSSASGPTWTALSFASEPTSAALFRASASERAQLRFLKNDENDTEINENDKEICENVLSSAFSKR